MSNTSTDISQVFFDMFYCMREPHVGFVWTSVAMTLCFILGTPAHSWLLWNFLHAGCQIKPTQVFPLSLTVMDLLFCVHECVEVLNLYILQNITIAWVLIFTFGLSWISRLLIQVCICFEQYLAVLHPITFLRYKGIHYRIALAATSCLLSSGYGLLIVFGVVEFPDFIFLSVCFIGAIVILFCCASVLCVLKTAGPGDREITKARNVGNLQKRNAFQIISVVLLTVLLSYIPLAAIFCFMKTNWILLNCDIIPILMSPNMFCVMCPPLLKLYKEGPLKCINNQLRNSIT